MQPPSLGTLRLLTATVIVAVASLSAPIGARAQPGVLAFDEIIVGEAQIHQPMFVVTGETFDQWVFGANNAAQQWNALEAQVNIRIESVDRVCSLSDEQKEKLRLAGRGDIAGFRNGYDDLKQKLQGTQHNPNEVNKVFQQIQPLQRQWQAGLFGEASLLEKVVKRTLTPEQAAKYEAEEAKRRAERYQAKIELAVAVLENTVPMTDAQRTAFVKLMLDETKPPLKFGPQDYQVVLVQAGRLPEAKLRAIFDEAQFRTLNQMFQQRRGMERALIDGGVILGGAIIDR